MATHKSQSAADAAKEILAAASDHSGKADAHVIYARDWLRSGREHDARKYVAHMLRGGRASPAMQALAADIIDPRIATKSRGRKVIERPKDWMEVGSAFEQYRQQGMTYELALDEVMKDFGTRKTSTDAAVRYFLAVSNNIDGK
ncbi:hypothetical protein [Mesorhizobium sp. ISC15]|uniref:hypothetical protein n=1 Tax=Mesorhizobium sp. ISC15 TaxID=3076429 RepID=UPI00301C1081